MQRRNTRQRRLVLDAVRALHDHPTVDEVFNEVRRHDDRVSRGTVYRNLALLADEGSVQMLKTPGGNRFDDRCDPHAHLICTSCGTVCDLELPYESAQDDAAMRETGFSQVTHYAFFEGVCPACQARGNGRTKNGTPGMFS